METHRNTAACAMWHAGAWQDTWQAEDAARGTPTQLLVAGEPTTFEALNATAYGSQHLQAYLLSGSLLSLLVYSY